ncbi:MAG: VOC family protein [Varibaculum sp.]|nr:VOC family protein [Varibaculum sp.]
MPSRLVKGAALTALLAAQVAGGRMAYNIFKEYREVGREDFMAEKKRQARGWRPLARSHGFAHVGITVTDFNAAVTWYNRLFKMRLINHLVITGEDLEPLQNLYHIEGLRSVELGFMVGEFGMIELFQFDPAVEDGARETWNRPGYTHVCFNVSDLPTWVARLRAEGVEFVCEPQHSQGADWVFFRDPQGNLVELMDMHASRLAVEHLGGVVGEVMKHTRLRAFYNR